MNECPFCGRDHDKEELAGRDEDGHPIMVTGPACHCVYESHVRIAIGICCGRMLGPDLLREEDESDRKWALKNSTKQGGESVDGTPEMCRFDTNTD